MGTLWTPGGERPVGGDPAPPPRAEAGPPPGAGAGGPESEAELEARMNELRRQLSETPASVVIANHCFGLFELAALHLSLQPPQLDQAQLAIDALGAIVDGLAGRLGQEEETVKDGLAQLRLAYVQLKAATTSGSAPA
jgi:hypothetical protein